MADITMCSGHECPMKENCYRFMAIPNINRQSYFFSPPIKSDGSCDSFGQDDTKYETIRFKVPSKFLAKIHGEDLIESQIRLFLNEYRNHMYDFLDDDFLESISLFYAVFDEMCQDGHKEFDVKVQKFNCDFIKRIADDYVIDHVTLFHYFMIMGEVKLSQQGL